MPNTRPVPDSVEHMDRLQQLIQDNAQVRVLPYASITVRQAGKEHVDFDALAKQVRLLSLTTALVCRNQQ